ncbi:hypothetical protein E5161_17490 [Cohnella pontilimi]|uniref:PKD domain-containing protein n=1 Tax=Cohnella pontilimi TaxID=2564100 RepID=A0A4U0F9G5_9BACL|nr:hypothetical protein [Cohnella pontilimi]TJY39742.1 hypothetical protein E5161_17490 [Cohnella pontilimi]
MSIDDTSAQAIDPYVQAAYPITGWQWSWSAIEGSDSDRRMKMDGTQHKEFLYKKPGEYQVTLTVTNALGRKSEVYVLPFTVLRDENPAVVFYPYSSQISREDAVTFVDDAVSTDYDTITTERIEVYYDVNGDETYSEWIDTISGPLTQYKPAASRLGKYRIKITVEEDFGQETFPEFITEADKRRTTKQFEFIVDNYIPYNDIYTDIPAVRPQIDAYFMADKNLAQSKIDYLKSSTVTINNGLRREGADPQVNVWDMHTYTYSQPGSTTYNTGQSYPPAKYYWCSSGGYCGTLDRQSVTDNGTNVDFGYDATKPMSDSHGATSSCSSSGFVAAGSSPETAKCPSSVYYSSGGYSGTLSQSSYDYSSQGVYDSKGNYLGFNWVRYYTYSGTVTKTWTETYHVYDWRWVPNYYGYYTGTLYKDIRQPFTNPFTRTTSQKYIIYISDNIINELPDFNRVKGISDAKIILVGSPPITGQSSPADFIENKGQPIEELTQSVIDTISSQFAATAAQTVLVNETFNLLTEETDPELDPIVLQQMQYVHDEHFYDNPTGHASFALTAFDPTKYTAESLKTSFAFPGEYRIFRRVKDQPSTDPKFAKYSYYSNDAETIVRVHRKPIAEAELDWTYDVNCSCYRTTWVDKSYDLDHNVSDPVNKGIVERKIRYQFSGEWYYRIPDELAPGSYRLEYTVKDIEGVWSDPFVMTFTLSPAPPPQLKGNLKAEDGAFTLAGGVPAGENLVAHKLWTRYPSSVNLELLMSVSGNYIRKVVPYYTGTKSGSDIEWSDVNTGIPATTPDGSYIYRIQANAANGTKANLDFPVKVLTPIQLTPEIRTSYGVSDTATVGQPMTVAATTTEYAHQVTVIAFKGQPFQKSLTLSGTVTSTAGTGSKEWSVSFTPQKPIADGVYTFEWTARTPNGNVEIKTMSVKIVNNTAPTGDFTVFTYDGKDASMPIFEGDTAHIRSLNLADAERDSLVVRYEVFDPSGTKRLDDSATVAYPYAATGPDMALPTGTVAVGTWTVKQTISDGKAPAVTRTRTFMVRALGIQGVVKHTEAWEANRLRYNEKHPDAQRPADWFWAGEAFVLEATVTESGTSWTKPVSVVAAATPQLRKALSAVPASPLWKGVLGSGDAGGPLNELPEGAYSFVFTVTYSNGVVKTSTVTIRLRDNIDDYVQVHRVQ